MILRPDAAAHRSRRSDSNLYGHRLYHGRHRLAASIAVGFSLVPAVIVRDLDEIKHAEGMAPN
jgi:ParB-like chromosome segregation protein Spo0J